MIPADGPILPYSEANSLSIRTIDDIIKDARSGFYLMKEQRLTKLKSAELAAPKPIFTKLIEDIRQEFDPPSRKCTAESGIRPLAIPVVKLSTLTNPMELQDVSSRNSTAAAVPLNGDGVELVKRLRPRSAPSTSQRRLAMIRKDSPPKETDRLFESSSSHSNNGSFRSSLKNKVWNDISAARNLTDNTVDDGFDSSKLPQFESFRSTYSTIPL